MPLFEFMCRKCGSQFEELVRNVSAIESVVCPNCHSTEIKKSVHFCARSEVAVHPSPWGLQLRLAVLAVLEHPWLVVGNNPQISRVLFY
jgi:putative FmdB family regulatory protein